jgi:peptide/nickel transport system substrate-binding protein
MRHRLATGAAIVAALAVVAGCATPSTEPTVDSIRIGVTPDRLSGVYSALNLSALGLDTIAMYQTLFTASPEVAYEFEPNAATAYELSDDWKTITITLRDDIVFTDGEPLTAPGLKAYFDELATSEDWGAKANWDAGEITLEAPDDTTLIISSSRPINPRTPSFGLDFIALMPFASPRALDDLEATEDAPAGSGPYVLESVTPGVEATLVKNEDYWNADAIPFEEMTILVFQDQVAGLNALKAGQIDTTGSNAPLAVEAEAAGFRVDEGAGNTAYLYIADREGTLQPAFADVRVRQAMAYAFDREAINESLNLGFGEVTSQPFLPGKPEYGDGGDDPYAYDPDHARELMAEAGYADGFDLVIPGGTFQGNNVWAPVVQQYLGDIGIRVTFDEFPDGSAFFTAMLSGEYPVLLYGMNRVSALPFFVAPGWLFDIFKIENPFISESWDSMMNGPDEATEPAARELGQYVLDEVFLVPFATPSSIWVSAPGYSVNMSTWGSYVAPTDFEVAE